MTEPLVAVVSTKIIHTAEGLRVLVYRAGLDLSTSHVRFLAKLLRGHRRVIGCRRRRATPGRQALVVLAHLRCGDTYTRLGAGFGLGVATVYRYVREAVGVLAGLAPDLQTATRVAARKAFLILDGTLLAIDRVGWPPARTGPTTRGNTSVTG